MTQHMKKGGRGVGEEDKSVSNYFHLGVEMCNVFSAHNRPSLCVMTMKQAAIQIYLLKF
jgi:hypothetical protein